MDNAQLLKGVLEGCVLAIIAEGETYGYEIIGALEKAGFEEIGEGTLYPVLTRLDKNKLILCRRAKSPLGPVRKYYSIIDRYLTATMTAAPASSVMVTFRWRFFSDTSVAINSRMKAFTQKYLFAGPPM